MSKRVSALGFCLLLAAGSAHAQNSLLATANRQPTTLSERLRNSECERMRWEADQTHLRAAIPNRDQQPDLRPIHIDSTAQPPLTLPKLRREWLQPSREVSADIVPAPDGHPSEYFLPKPQKVKP